MTFSHVNRRVHLYLGLFILPWLFMYGISALPLAHASLFGLVALEELDGALVHAA